MRKKAALIILDGFGYREEKVGNAILNANMDYYHKLWDENPHTTLGASGEDVGLPEGQMGNSEVGHLNIGAGRIVYQTYSRINNSIKDKSFYKNPVFLEAIAKAKENNSKLHLIGLFSDGGVHSHLNHFFAVLEIAKEQGLKDVYIHACLDGRDVPPSCAEKYFKLFEEKQKKLQTGKIASISGRFYTMDRDKRWERVEKAYNAMVLGEGYSYSSALGALKEAYKRGESDEFVSPSIIDKNGLIEENDSVLFMNFRPDRAREISEALALPDFDGFKRKALNLNYFTLANYDETFPFKVAFDNIEMKNILAEVLSNNNLRQLRIAETEKYAHVTFFFNGQIETPFALEERVLIASPKVATYDLQPEMSALEVTDKLLEQIEADKQDVIILNYANPDMVGHTGNMKATIKALECLDNCLAKIIEKLKEKGFDILISADHGNADLMQDEHGNTLTAHSTNKVPFILVSSNKNLSLKEGGRLSDIAPTLLELLNIEKPSEMSGTSLVERRNTCKQ